MRLARFSPLAFVVVGTACTATGEGVVDPTRLTATVGYRRMLDDDLWKPLEEHGAVGLQLSHDARPLGFEIGVLASESNEDDVAPNADASARLLEVFAGVHREFGGGDVQPYLGAGLSLVHAELEIDGGGIDDIDRTGAIGYYAHVGVNWFLASGFFLGVDLRYLHHAELELFDVEGEADNLQFGLNVGVAF